MPAIQLREFSTGAEMRAHYAAIKAKRLGLKPATFFPQKPAPVAAPIDEPIPDAPDHSPVTMEKIIRMVCLHYGFPKSALVSRWRQQQLARGRQIVSYLAEHHTGLTRPAIGLHLGGIDNSTVIHGIDRITKLRATDPAITADIEAILARLFPPFTGEVPG